MKKMSVMPYLLHIIGIGTLYADPLIVTITNNSQEPYEYTYQTPQEESFTTWGEECTYNEKKISFPSRNERITFQDNQIKALRKWHDEGEKGKRPHLLQLKCKPARVTQKISTFTGSIKPNTSLAINHDITRETLSLTPYAFSEDQPYATQKKIPLLKITKMTGLYLVTKTFFEECNDKTTKNFVKKPIDEKTILPKKDLCKVEPEGTNTFPFPFEPNGRYRLIIHQDFSVTLEKIL